MVAEIASNHRGSKELAHRLIYEASLAGCDIAKFQFGYNHAAQQEIFREGHIPGKYDPVRYIDKWADDLYGWCEQYGIELMASIWSEEGLETARAFCKRYKIAHQMTGFQFLMDKETFISRVYKYPIMPTSSDIKKVIYTTDEYPTNHVDLPPFSEDGWYGYSDHTIGIDYCLSACAKGAKYIEKHMTLNLDNLEKRDHVLSATPSEMTELVRIGRRLARIA